LARNTHIARIGLGLLFAGSMLFYVQRILVPYQQRDAEIHNRLRGNLSDLYPQWVAARELLLNGRDPYSAEITREIQTGFYGRPLDPARPDDPKDEQRFAYPVYVAFLLAPTVRLPFDLAQTVFFWLLVALSAASALLWMDFLKWRPSAAGVLLALLLTLGSFPVLQGVKLQQLSLLEGFLLALSAALLARGYLFTSGAFMAVAMIKPQLAIPVAGWFCIWSIFSWRNRRAWVLGFGLTMFILLAASEWLMPGWVARFFDTAVAYRVYAANGGILDTVFSPIGVKFLTVLLVLVVVAFCWRFRRLPETQAGFQRITALVLAATLVILPMIVAYNHVLLLPSFFLLARQWMGLSSHGRASRALSIAAGVLIAWPWPAATALTLLSAIASPEQVQRAWAFPLLSSPLIPIAVLGVQLVSVATQNTDKPESA
jgi:hypothetical protein